MTIINGGPLFDAPPAPVPGDARAVLARLVATLPACLCGLPATRAYRRGSDRYCDACQTPYPPPPDYPRAPALREAVALLATPAPVPGDAVRALLDALPRCEEADYQRRHSRVVPTCKTHGTHADGGWVWCSEHAPAGARPAPWAAPAARVAATLATPAPAPGDDVRALLEARPMTVRTMVAWLAQFDPDLQIILSKDAEGNDHSPLAPGASGTAHYIAATTWHGELADPDDNLPSNALVLVPVS